MSCAPLRPYIHHTIHPFLIDDLKRMNTWDEALPPLVLTRHCRGIDEEETRSDIANWIESQYGEFPGDIINRYMDAFQGAGETELLNSDWLCVYEKRSADNSVEDRNDGDLCFYSALAAVLLGPLAALFSLAIFSVQPELTRKRIAALIISIAAIVGPIAAAMPMGSGELLTMLYSKQMFIYAIRNFIHGQ